MYHAAKVLLFRAILSPATKEARADPNSSLRRNFHEAVHEMQQFATFMDEVTEGDLQGFWGRRKLPAPTPEHYTCLTHCQWHGLNLYSAETS